jgi:hypothetical protein
MLPRRHILDVWEFMKDRKDLLPMSTLTLAIDAIKHVDPKSKKDHLVEALELNEFICYMFPVMRPKNRALLFHVVSDLLGLLMYGVPQKTRRAIENLETINYSEKNIEIYPVIEVWNELKDRVYTKKHGVTDVIEGFIKKIRIEMDILERFPLIEDIFTASREDLKHWLPALSSYYDRKGKTIRAEYDKWWALWSFNGDKDAVLGDLVERLYQQALREFAVEVDREKIVDMVKRDTEGNRQENELFSHWYQEGVNFLLKI